MPDWGGDLREGYKKLSEAVGDESFDGAILEEQQNEAIRIRDMYLAKVEEYRSKQSTYSMFDGFGPYCEDHYEKLIRMYNNLADISQRLYNALKEKETRYWDIERRTSSLFTTSEQIRVAVKSALESMAGAFVNGVYQPDMQAQWRADITDCYINRVFFISDDGKLIINWDEVEEILSKEAGEITENEYTALALIYINADVSEMGQMLQYMMGERRDVAIATLCDKDYSEWKIDQAKLDGVITSVAGAAEQSLYIDRVMGNILINSNVDMMSERDIILQRLAFLSVVKEIGTFRNTYQEANPDIRVMVNDKSEIVLCFKEMKYVGTSGSTLGISNLEESSVTVGRTLGSESIDD